MRKHLLTLICALCALLLIPNTGKAADYTIADGTALSNVLPIVPGVSYTSSATQQIYLASELSAEGAGAGNITGLTFYYGGKSGTTAVSSVTPAPASSGPVSGSPAASAVSISVSSFTGTSAAVSPSCALSGAVSAADTGTCRLIIDNTKNSVTR